MISVSHFSFSCKWYHVETETGLWLNSCFGTFYQLTWHSLNYTFQMVNYELFRKELRNAIFASSLFHPFHVSSTNPVSSGAAC